MKESEETKPKPSLTIGILNKHSEERTMLIGAIVKTLALLQKKQNETRFPFGFGPAILLENKMGYTFETSQVTFSLLEGSAWEYKYMEFMTQNAWKMSGAIYVVSVRLDRDEVIEEQLGFIKNLGISPLLVYLNTGAFNYPVATNEEIMTVEARVRRLLAKFGYFDEILIVSGNTTNALESSNFDSIEPEYAPIIELIKTMEQYFLPK